MRLFAYIRVSSKDQNEDRQVIAMKKQQVPKENIYIDKKSGKNFNRPAYKRLMKRLKPGDLLIVEPIDRLGRNYEEIIEQWRHLTKERGIDIRVLDMPLLDMTIAKDILGTFIADLVLQILSYCAHLEREKIHQRQADGIAVAKDRGVKFGREKKELPPDFEELYTAWRQGELSPAEFEKRCGMALSVIYRKLKADGKPEHQVRPHHRGGRKR